MSKSIGYSFWGFLGDIKMNEKFERISTPDGNAFYSWSIIQALQSSGNNVTLVMPDRDAPGFSKLGKGIFSAWLEKKRAKAYKKANKIKYPENLLGLWREDVFKIWDESGLDGSDFILHEWRMEIPGRNTEDARMSENWQPDLFLQNCLVEYCKRNEIKLVIFDLDYKLSEKQFEYMKDFASIIELGTKWQNTKFANKAKTVCIPFDFSEINNFQIKDDARTNLVYIGNRYERDWCIDKYIPENLDKCTVYGNWKEAGRDSENKWPLINFGKRLQTEEMNEVYADSICTILLAKEEYCTYGFMTARLIESIFYGTVPLFIEEYGEDTIKKFAGVYGELLTVTDKEDVSDAVIYFKNNQFVRRQVIYYLREYLGTIMDANNFVKDLYEAIHL